MNTALKVFRWSLGCRFIDFTLNYFGMLFTDGNHLSLFFCLDNLFRKSSLLLLAFVFAWCLSVHEARRWLRKHLPASANVLSRLDATEDHWLVTVCD